MDWFQRKRPRLRNIDNLLLVVEKFILHSPSAPHKQRIVEIKGNYAHAIYGPTKHMQGVV